MHKSNILFLIIRSGSITGLLSSYDKEGNSDYVEIKKDIIFDTTKSHKSFDTETYNTLESIAEACINRSLNLPLPDKVVCVYSSPWFDSQISEYDIPFNKKGFSYKLLDDLSSDASDLDSDVILIDQNIESITLNGYKTNNPKGQKYSEGTVTFLTSWITNDVKEGVESVIHKVLNDREIQHITLPHIINTVVGSHSNSYHVLDIHGEATDIINIQNDSIDSTGSIPSGINSLIRSIRKENQSYQETHEEFNHILKGLIDPIKCREEKENIKIALSEWVESLNAIPDFRENNNIILISQNNTEKIFSEALKGSYGDHNKDIQFLDKSYFAHGLDTDYKDLNITSLMVIAFWKRREEKVVNIHRLQS